MTAILIGAAILLAGAALALALEGNVRRAWVSILSQALATALILSSVVPTLWSGDELHEVVGWSYPVETIAFHLDALSAFFLAWSLPMTLIGSIYALGYLRPYFATRNAGVHFALLNLTSLSFVMIYTLENAMVFLLGWEIAAVAAWLLVIWDYRSQKIRFAGFNYLVSTHAGLFVLVGAFMVMYSQTSSMEFDAFGAFLSVPSPLRNLTFVLLVTAFGIKSAFFPFHTWLPRAHAAAPAHVSALMSGVIHKAGLFGLLRFTLLMKEPEAWMGWYLLAFSALSAGIGVLYTSSQRDLKRLLGYSSTENVGIAGLGFAVGYLGLCWHLPALVVLGFTGGLLHILNHALFKSLLFLAAGAVHRATHSVDLARLGGIARAMPVTATCFLLGSLAISALPPFNGFVSEFLIYAGLLDGSVPAGLGRVLFIAVAALLAFVGGVSALSMMRAFGLGFLGRTRDPALSCSGEVSRSMIVPMVTLAVAIVALGLVPTVGLAVVRAPAALFVALLDGEGAAAGAEVMTPARALAPIAWMTGALVVLVLVLIAARRRLLRRTASAAQPTWGCGYPAATPRMQYTAGSFSAQLTSLFAPILPHLRRAKLPEEPFPAHDGQLDTHSVDAVERRMFDVLGDGDKLVRRLADRIPEEPRFSFGIGLAVVLVAVAVLLAGGGVFE